MIGGYQQSSAFNDIWHSSDGKNWQKVTVTGDQWSKRWAPLSLVFNDKLYIVRGTNCCYNLYSDIYSSSDGIDWERVRDSSPFGGYNEGAGLVNFKGKMWLFGGSAYTTFTNDVWSSSDGMNWAKEKTPPWSKRAFHTSLVFKDKIWIIGGNLDGTASNEVWNSADGITWTKVKANNDKGFLPARAIHASVVFDNKLWVIGGSSNNKMLNDVWSSSDGVNWTQEQSAPWSARRSHTAVVFDNKIWVIGGRDRNKKSNNEVWAFGDFSE